MEGEPPVYFFSKGSQLVHAAERVLSESRFCFYLFLLSKVNRHFRGQSVSVFIHLSFATLPPPTPNLTLDSDNFSALLPFRGCQGSTLILQRRNTYGVSLKWQQTSGGITSFCMIFSSMASMSIGIGLT